MSAPALADRVADETAAVTAIPLSARELRKARARRIVRRYVAGVGLPTVMALIYYLGVAAPQYDSNAVIAVESTEGRTAPEASGRDSNAGNARDARMLREHLNSHELMDRLEREHGLVKHWQRGGDWWGRLAADAGTETRFQYFKDKVRATGAAQSNLVALRVRAFAPGTAQTALKTMIADAQQWVDARSQRDEAAMLTPAEAAVEQAKTRLLAVLPPDAPATGTAPETPPTKPHSELVEIKLAEQSLEAAMQTLQSVRLDIARSHRLLTVVDSPTLPTESVYPRTWWMVATVFATAVALVSVLSLLGAAVREHANF